MPDNITNGGPLADLPVDAFDLELLSGPGIETIEASYGMTEGGDSGFPAGSCSCSCCAVVLCCT